MSTWRDPEPGDRYIDTYGDVFNVTQVVNEVAYGHWDYRNIRDDNLRFATLNGDGFTLLPERRSPWRRLLDTLGLRSKGTQLANHPDRSNPK